MFRFYRVLVTMVKTQYNNEKPTRTRKRGPENYRISKLSLKLTTRQQIWPMINFFPYFYKKFVYDPTPITF